MQGLEDVIVLRVAVPVQQDDQGRLFRGRAQEQVHADAGSGWQLDLQIVAFRSRERARAA